MKVNRKQRFPRIYSSRQIKPGVEYFGPFISRGQFTRLKTTLERTFKLRPCLYNIRGNDPHPDCLYFQMHTCSRPCNNDINRSTYLQDVDEAIAFIEGRDAEIDRTLLAAMNDLAAQTRFEEAEVVRKRLDKIHRARQECKDTFFSVWKFNYVVVLPSDSVHRCKIAFVRKGRIAGFEQYEVESLEEPLVHDLRRIFQNSSDEESGGSTYDEFCLVSNFIVDPLQSVELIPIQEVESLPGVIKQHIQQLQQRKRKRKSTDVDTVAG
jgi:excinuclease UvrABC nuclease subunit